MILRRETKIIFIILGLIAIAALIFLTAEYPKLKKPPQQKNPVIQEQADDASGGKCSPDLANCKGNPELCMAENKNQVCD